MKRVLAIATILLTPGLIFVGMSLWCMFAMAECPMAPSCHEQETAGLQASACCLNFDTAAAGSSLHTDHFSLPVPVSAESGRGLPLVGNSTQPGAVLASGNASPLVLNLRV